MPDLHIVLMREGAYNRGGLRHEGHKVHKLEDLTPVQLRELHDDPRLTLIVGGQVLTEEQVADVEKAAAAKADKAKAKG